MSRQNYSIALPRTASHLQELQQLHQHLQPRVDKTSEPPQKKNRVSNGSPSAVLTQIEVDEAFPDDFVVDKVDLEVVLGSATNGPGRSDALRRNDNDTFVVAHLATNSLWQNRETPFLRINFSSFDRRDYAIYFPTNMADSIHARLAWIRKTPTRPPRSANSNPAWAHFKVTFVGGSSEHMQLEAYFLWRKDTAGALNSHVASVDTLSAALPAPLSSDVLAAQSRGSWEVSDFYDAVHVPSKALKLAPALQTAPLECGLYPFQQRAVDWLLHREGVEFQINGLLQNLPEEQKSPPPSCYQPVEDALGRRSFCSQMHGMITDKPRQYRSLPGGILCEEMGLGKTVELLALIQLHKRKTVLMGRNQWGLFESSATLIITPPHLLQQWQSEIARHAPNLSVVIYRGVQYLNHLVTDEQHIQGLLSCDVVLTTYSVLTKEIHFAEKAPERRMRHSKVYNPRRSPLVQISWWRLCLDEAQMIDTGVTKAAIVARLIPRMNAWAVTGTPLKKNLEDLYGLLLFLGYEPFCDDKKLWLRVDKQTFSAIVNQIALRHTKDIVRHELKLPPQKRVVLTMPFTAIEDQNYAQLVQQMCEDCGLKPDGSPATENINFESPALTSKLRDWLQRLRQTCLHPHVGTRNRRRLGRGNRPLRTVDEVLEIMIDQNETGLRSEQRQLILLKVRYGLIIANNQSDEKRWSTAAQVFLKALENASRTVSAARDEHAAEKERICSGNPANRLNTADDRETEDEEDGKSEGNTRLASLQKAIRSAVEVEHVCAFFAATAYFQLKEAEAQKCAKTQDSVRKSESEGPNEAVSAGRTAENKESKTDEPPRSGDYMRLENLETKFYEQAKCMRKEMLKDSDDAAQRLMKQVTALRGSTRCKTISTLEDYGGIESRRFLEKLDDLVDLLQRQGSFLEEVRDKAQACLMMPLIDEDDSKELSGEEYEDSTRKQDELPVYITILRALTGDRHHMLTGQINPFVSYDEAKTLERRARTGTIVDDEDKGPAPELMLKLLEKRKSLLLVSDEELETAKKYHNYHDQNSLRAIISGIRSTATALQWQSTAGTARARPELAIIERHAKDAQQMSTTQIKIVEELEKDVELFVRTMNQRLEFYRQLQVISDTVVPFKEEQDERLDEVALQQQQADEERSKQRLAQLTTKQRFLQHLRLESSSTEAKTCVICQCEFENGVLTVCGHASCKECIGLWWRQHRTCPVCRRRLHLNDFHDITYKPQVLRAEEEPQISASPSKSEDESNDDSTSINLSGGIYNDIGANTLREIKSVDLNGSYGTKIDTIVRHLLWIRQHDPGAKSLVYSQFADFLEVLNGALQHFKIGRTTCREKQGVKRFREDPSIECFLLDAKSDSSGLNLVNATYIFLCEPLINPAVELQAIARVHRIGQQRPTTVFMYLVSDSVEESIYQISVARRMAHIGELGQKSRQDARCGTQTPQVQEIVLEQANSLELQAAPLSAVLTKGRGGGEVVDDKDLWNCLFGKKSARPEGASGELAREVDTFLRAEAADERRLQNSQNGVERF